MINKNYFFYLIFNIININLYSQEPLSVIITEDCSMVSGIYTFSNTLNGKNNYINQITNSDTGETIEVKIGYDGFIWVSYIGDDLSDVGFYNENVPEGMLPPNNDWQNFDCENGSMVIEGGITISIMEYKSLEKFIFYPNPVKDYLIITNDSEYDKLYIINSIGMNVKTILKKSKNQINISYLSKGLYFIKVYRKNDVVDIYKFIKK